MKKGVDFPSFKLLDDVWFTALALHNMLLERSEGDIQVTGSRQEDEEDEEEQAAVGPVPVFGPVPVVVSPVPEVISVDFNPLRWDLIRHYWYQWNHRRVTWSSRNGNPRLKKFTFAGDD